MSWNPYTDPVNYILLEGKRSPGLADVAGAGTPRNWEERKGYGLSGAVLWFTGLGLASFTVEFRLYTVQDWNDWHAWKSTVQRPPFGTLPRAKDIWHPLLADLGIKSVVVADVKQAKQTEDGVWTIPVDFKEHRKLKLTLAKPEGSTTKEPTDPYDIKNDQLNKQNQALAAEKARLLGGS